MDDLISAWDHSHFSKDSEEGIISASILSIAEASVYWWNYFYQRV